MTVSERGPVEPEEVTLAEVLAQFPGVRSRLSGSSQAAQEVQGELLAGAALALFLIAAVCLPIWISFHSGVIGNLCAWMTGTGKMWGGGIDYLWGAVILAGVVTGLLLGSLLALVLLGAASAARAWASTKAMMARLSGSDAGPAPRKPSRRPSTHGPRPPARGRGARPGSRRASPA